MSIKKMVAGGLASAMLAISMVGAASALHGANANGSFETGINPGVFTTLSAGDSTSIANWTVSAGTVDYIGSYWIASDGTDSLDMSGNNEGAVSKTFLTDVGQTYTVTFALAGNPAGGPAVKTLNVDAGGAPATYTFDTTGQTLTDMGWESQTFTFVAAAANTTLTFTSLTPGFFGPALDNVVVSLTPLANKDQCKNNGWKTFQSLNFRNQGDCVSYVQSSPNATGNRADNL